MINDVLTWFGDSAHWSGPDGVPVRLFEHIWYSTVCLLVAAVVAIPAGLLIGHTGRGRFLVVNLVGAARAIPSLGLLFLVYIFLTSRLSGDFAFLAPTFVVLVVLAIPPILSGAYAGVEGVDPAARDAAKGMGMTGAQVLTRVEVPNALPLIASGVRSAALQVVATATIAAILSVGGLGRFIIDGLAIRDFGQMAAGAVLVALLAIVTDFVLAAIQYLVVSPGITGRGQSRGARSSTVANLGTADETEPQQVG